MQAALTPDVLIVGAGVAGLACGVALSDAGLRVTVVERSALLGGRAASWREPTTGVTVDIGPHVLTSEHHNLLALMRRLGTETQVLWQPQPLITLLDEDRRLAMRGSRLPPPLHGLPNLPQALKSVSWRDLWSNRRVAWRALRINEQQSLELDEIDARQWLQDMGVRADFIEWFWRPACLAILNVPLERCSATALVRVFRLMAGRNGYCFGFPKQGLADLYAPGCRGVIEAAGGQVLLNTEVKQVLLRDGRFDAVVLADGSRLQARSAVVAVPPENLAEMAPPDWREIDPAPTLAAQLEPCPYVSSYLWFDRKLTRQHFWARTWSPGDLNLDFYDLSNIREGDTEAGAETPSLIASNSIYAHAAAELSDDEIVRRTVAEIAEFAPEAAQARVVHADVHRISMAVVCPQPGTETARPAAATPFENLWLAGDWTRTGLPSSMESAARSGALAAEQAGAWLGRPLLAAQPVPETRGLPAMLRSRSLS
ncbi:hydroxysqualene dehydroxylase HpnE [Caldimonas brevitalea]|uniref:Amine oxidase n=1 Tax=Caldimonas brevitalea TaxID=413882 RepID=A0A0G3BMF2_9BURK|nr:hydroxysqualene dehydroxylase HpnE [Caldimonas brevitalea]AKJ29158.1 amine oxidase [Caldimonas brevitalea]